MYAWRLFPWLWPWKPDKNVFYEEMNANTVFPCFDILSCILDALSWSFIVEKKKPEENQQRSRKALITSLAILTASSVEFWTRFSVILKLNFSKCRQVTLRPVEENQLPLKMLRRRQQPLCHISLQIFPREGQAHKVQYKLNLRFLSKGTFEIIFFIGHFLFIRFRLTLVDSSTTLYESYFMFVQNSWCLKFHSILCQCYVIFKANVFRKISQH